MKEYAISFNTHKKDDATILTGVIIVIGECQLADTETMDISGAYHPRDKELETYGLANPSGKAPASAPAQKTQ